MTMTPIDILRTASDPILADTIVESYLEVERNYFRKNWKTSELDAGHFVEAVRRFIDLKLRGSYLPIGQSLPSFNDAVLRQYENSSGDESYRIILPRVLFAIYSIRNKRGVGHLGLVKPNMIDARIIMNSVKWVFAELIRLNSALSLEDTEGLIENIIRREIDIIWKHGNVTRILKPNLKVEEKVLIILFDKSPQSVHALQESTKYKNRSNFTSALKSLDRRLLIEYQADGLCFITPLGEERAQKLLVDY